jgi:branched-chain amino acid transport system permease protein
VIGAFTNSWMLWFGLLFVLVVLFRPEGIAGLVKSSFERHSLRRQGLSALRLIFRSG